MKSLNYSIIIPHFNIHKLLRRLLLSIPRRDDLQIIVVDDCSTKDLDEYEQVKKDFPYVEFYSTGTNGGGGKARNIGLKHAKGKFLIFADSDDFFNYCFEDALDKYQFSDYDIIYFAANSVNTDNYQSSGRALVQTDLINKAVTDRSPELLLHKFTAPWCKFINKSLVDENAILFQESIVFNDMYFSLQVDSKVRNITCDKLAIYCVTYRENSVSSVSTPEKEIKKMEVASNYCKMGLKLGCQIQPIYNLIGPTFSVVYGNRWSNIYEEIRKPWNKIGLSDKKIYWYFVKYLFYSKIATPALQIIKIISGR